MERVSYYRVVEVVLRISVGDAKILAECARKHYDSRCKEAADQGGVLYGILNRLCWSCGGDVTQMTLLSTNKYDKVVGETFPIKEENIQTMTKIAEQGPDRIHSHLIQILREMHWEEARINNRCPACNSEMPTIEKNGFSPIHAANGMEFCCENCIKDFKRRYGK